MYSIDYLEKAVMYAQQDPLALANILSDFEKYIRNDKKVLENFAVVVGDASIAGVINQTAKTVAITVPNGTVVTALVSQFIISQYATLKVGSTIQASGTTTNNFTSAVTFVVHAKDGTTQNYVVTVTVAEAEEV